jgi:hypothetical protein
MAGGRGLVAVEGQAWDGLLSVLADAVQRGDTRGLGQRLAGLDAGEEALQDLAALPVRACSAIGGEGLLRAGNCSAGRGCPVQEECPLVRGDPSEMGRSALGRALGAAVDALRRPGEDPPVADLEELRGWVEQLLRASGRVAPDSPPRARTSVTVLDMSLGRGGVAGVTGSYLRSGELEQVAAFVPPGSGQQEEGLAEIEAWLRRSVCLESALLEIP